MSHNYHICWHHCLLIALWITKWNTRPPSPPNTHTHTLCAISDMYKWSWWLPYQFVTKHMCYMAALGSVGPSTVSSRLCKLPGRIWPTCQCFCVSEGVRASVAGTTEGRGEGWKAGCCMESQSPLMGPLWFGIAFISFLPFPLCDSNEFVMLAPVNVQ